MAKSLNTIPEIKKLWFDFNWDTNKVWALEYPVEKVPVELITWHLDIPLWDNGRKKNNLTPYNVLDNPAKHWKRFKRIIDADLNYPLDIMWWKGRWMMLDGVHRLSKAVYLGHSTINVRKIPRRAIPLIIK